MRWIPYAIALYLLLLVQCTAGKILSFGAGPIGRVEPDLLAIVVVFAALHCPKGLDVAIAAWLAGLALDLTSAGGPGSLTAVGPMPIAYVLASAAVFKVREGVFRERAIPQALLALVFCLIAHGLWVSMQTFLSAGRAAGAAYGRGLLQAAALSVYTAALMPVAHLGLMRIRTWLIDSSAERLGRGRR